MGWITALLAGILGMLVLIFLALMAIDKRLAEQWGDLEPFVRCIWEDVEDYEIRDSEERAGRDHASD